MLVLNRKVDESIVIGHDIIITVIEVRGNRVRLGIQAPGNIRVDRQEVFDERKKFCEGTVVKYEGIPSPLIIARQDPLLLITVMGDGVYTNIHRDSLKVISHSDQPWSEMYPAAYKRFLRETT